MENQNYKIDEIFRQRLHDAEVPPPPFVWPAVEQELQKRRRRLLFVLLLAVGTVLASAVLWQSILWPRSNPGRSQAPAAELPQNLQEASPTGIPESSKNISSAKAAEKLVADAPSHSAKGASPSNKSKGEKDITAVNALVNQTEGSVEQTKLPASANLEDLFALKTKEPSISEELLEINDLQPVVSLFNPKNTPSPKLFKANSRRKKIQPKVCYDFARHPSAWLFDVYVGPSLAQRSLTSRLEDEPYLNQRLATEQRSTAMNAGLRASLMFNSNFLVRTGLHYDQVTEVFEYIDPTTVIYRLQFTPGNPIPDTLGVEYGENYLKTYNRYSMLDVPLIVGMELRRGRSGFSINAGISANVLFQKRGAIIDPSTHEPARFGSISTDPKAPGPKTSVSQDVFRTNVGLSATASIQWYWHLSSHFRLFVEPSFRQVLRPVTLGSHPVEQRYGILGLRLGATTIF